MLGHKKRGSLTTSPALSMGVEPPLQSLRGAAKLFKSQFGEGELQFRPHLAKT